MENTNRIKMKRINNQTTVLETMRIERGLRQKDIASAAGIHRTDVCRFENRTRIPSLRAAYALSKLFDVQMESLFDHEGVAI